MVRIRTRANLNPLCTVITFTTHGCSPEQKDRGVDRSQWNFKKDSDWRKTVPFNIDFTSETTPLYILEQYFVFLDGYHFTNFTPPATRWLQQFWWIRYEKASENLLLSPFTQTLIYLFPTRCHRQRMEGRLASAVFSIEIRKKNLSNQISISRFESYTQISHSTHILKILNRCPQTNSKDCLTYVSNITYPSLYRSV
jgi:hypothetical protein